MAIGAGPWPSSQRETPRLEGALPDLRFGGTCTGPAIVPIGTRGRRQRDGLDSDRAQAVSKTPDDLLTEVAAGSGLLYDGPPASSLDGQPLAIAIKAHLACPAIPAATELLRGLCTAAGLCLECAGCILHERVAALKEQAVAVQAAVERSQRFWRAMLDRLPEGCPLPLSLRFRWRRRVHCGHRGPLRLREPPWQPKSANAAVAAPGRAAARRAALSSSSSASSSLSSFELNKFTQARFSGGCAARCSGCTFPRVRPFRRRPPRGDGASSSLSRADFDNSVG